MIDQSIPQNPTPTEPTSSTQSTPPIVSQPPKGSGIFKWIILLTLAIILSSGGTYLFLKSQSKTTNQTGNNSYITQPSTIPPTITIIPSLDPTANWKTYSNSKYGYSIKYPEDYSVLEDSPDYVRFFQGPNDPTLPKRETYLSIQLDTNLDPSKNPKAIYKTTPGGKTLRISQIMMDIDDRQKPKVQSVFDQIISTFKFIGTTNGSNEFADWKTFTNGAFSFSYPQDSGWKVFPSVDNAVSAMCEICSTNSTVDLFQVGTVIFKSIDEYISKDTLTTDKKKITLSGLEAVEGIQSGGPQAGGSMIQVFVVYNGKGYLIGERFKTLYDKTLINEFPQAFPDILSTMKFK